jgi:hypothetical protein
LPGVDRGGVEFGSGIVGIGGEPSIDEGAEVAPERWFEAFRFIGMARVSGSFPYTAVTGTGAPPGVI